MTESEKEQHIVIDCYTDVLCVWAYVAQIRLNELHQRLAGKIRVRQHYINLFGATEHRIGEGWQQRGGYDAFADHVLEVCARFAHVQVNQQIWRSCRPLSSANAHLLLKAVQGMEGAGQAAADAAENLAWQVRLAFFRDARDIGDWDVLLAVAEEVQLRRDLIERQLRHGAAMAALARDQELRDQHAIAGSPTYVLDNGRQKLFGNVGYRVLEANVKELLEYSGEQASWC